MNKAFANLGETAARGRSSEPAAHCNDGLLMLRLVRAHTFFERLAGCWAIAWPQQHVGLLLKPCRAVHTFGLRAPTDVIFLDGKNGIVSIHENVPPNRVLICGKARQVVELPGGYCDEYGDIAPALAAALQTDFVSVRPDQSVSRQAQ